MPQIWLLKGSDLGLVKYWLLLAKQVYGSSFIEPSFTMSMEGDVVKDIKAILANVTMMLTDMTMHGNTSLVD